MTPSTSAAPTLHSLSVPTPASHRRAYITAADHYLDLTIAGLFTTRSLGRFTDAADRISTEAAEEVAAVPVGSSNRDVAVGLTTFLSTVTDVILADNDFSELDEQTLASATKACGAVTGYEPDADRINAIVVPMGGS